MSQCISNDTACDSGSINAIRESLSNISCASIRESLTAIDGRAQWLNDQARKAPSKGRHHRDQRQSLSSVVPHSRKRIDGLISRPGHRLINQAQRPSLAAVNAIDTANPSGINTARHWLALSRFKPGHEPGPIRRPSWTILARMYPAHPRAWIVSSNEIMAEYVKALDLR